VLFTAQTQARPVEEANVEVLSLPDHRRKTLQRGGLFGRYLSAQNGTGYLVYTSKGTLFAAPFDPHALELRGTPTPLLPEIDYSAVTGAAQFDLSLTGTLVYRRSSGGASGTMTTLQWVTPADGATGKKDTLRANPTGFKPVVIQIASRALMPLRAGRLPPA